MFELQLLLLLFSLAMLFAKLHMLIFWLNDRSCFKDYDRKIVKPQCADNSHLEKT
jgi:hypothetical protein